jgi:hypothetical protein
MLGRNFAGKSLARLCIRCKGRPDLPQSNSCDRLAQIQAASTRRQSGGAFFIFFTDSCSPRLQHFCGLFEFRRCGSEMRVRRCGRCGSGDAGQTKQSPSAWRSLEIISSDPHLLTRISFTDTLEVQNEQQVTMLSSLYGMEPGPLRTHLSAHWGFGEGVP